MTDITVSDASSETSVELVNPGSQPKRVRTPNSMARNAAIVAMAMIVSRGLGFVREIILANRFGTSSDYDAYISAFRIPDLLFLIIMSGAFGSAFIPVFNELLAKEDDADAWRLASSVMTWTAVITIVAGVIGFIFADPLMRYVVAPDLPEASHDVGVRVMRILLLSPLLLGMAIAAKGILEAQDLFTIPALAPIIYNITVIAAAIFAAPRWGVTAVAVGVVIGALLQFAFQLPALHRSGFSFDPSLSRSVIGLSTVAALLGPRVIGQAAFQINFIAVNHFATELGEGRASGLNYAWMMMMLPNGVLALSVSTVVFPTLTRQFNAGDIASARITFHNALRPLLFMLLPASILLYEFRTAIFQVLFQSGAFDDVSTQLTADPLAFFAVGLVFYGLVELLARTFFAMQDARTPVITGILIIAVNIVGSALLKERFDSPGLAMMLVISTGIEAMILLFVLERRLGTFQWHFGSWWARIVLASALMALTGELTSEILEDVIKDGESSRFVELFLMGVAMIATGVTYLIACASMHIPELIAIERRFAMTVQSVTRRNPQ